MQTRPWFKSLRDFIKGQRAAAKRAGEQFPQEKQVHEFPLSSDPVEPKPKLRNIGVPGAFGHNRKRNPVIIQEPSRDPKFNHALRRMLKKQ